MKIYCSHCSSQLTASCRLCKFVPFVGRQCVDHVCFVPQQPMNHQMLSPIRSRASLSVANARLALAHTVSEPVATLSSLATRNRGQSGRPAVCTWLHSVLAEGEWEMRSREREWELGCSAGRAEERSCKYRRLHAVESREEWQADRQQQAVNWAWEDAANSAKRRELRIDYR